MMMMMMMMITMMMMISMMMMMMMMMIIIIIIIIEFFLECCSGPRSSVGIATNYDLDGLRIEFRWGEVFRRPDRPWVPPNLLYNGYRLFPWSKKRSGRDADPLLPSSAEV